MGLKALIDRYVFNRDVQERRKEVMQTLEDGSRREAAAMRRVARATGDEGAERRAMKAERDAAWFRQKLADEVGIDVLRQG